MSRIVQVPNGDYRIQVQTGGNIFLDTQNSNGYVTVIGNLDVKGSMTYLETINTQINDNIIVLNAGQTGNGIDPAGSFDYPRQSGIEIKRGNYQDAMLVFNENVTHYNPVTSTTVAGTFVMKTADGTLSGLQVASIANAGTSNFVFDMQNNPYVLSVANASGYETYVTHDNDIPNRKYLYNYVAASNGVATVDRLYYPTGGGIGSSTSSVEAFASSIVFQISQVTKALISVAGLTVNNVNLYTDTISNVGSNNLVLTAANTNVEVSGVLNLDNQTWNTPVYASGTTKLYSSSTIGPGKTGLYFSNTGASQTPDELISRNRAVLLSILL